MEKKKTKRFPEGGGRRRKPLGPDSGKHHTRGAHIPRGFARIQREKSSITHFSLSLFSGQFTGRRDGEASDGTKKIYNVEYSQKSLKGGGLKSYMLICSDTFHSLALTAKTQHRNPKQILYSQK
jgi:hypothetical protein